MSDDVEMVLEQLDFMASCCHIAGVGSVSRAELDKRVAGSASCRGAMPRPTRCRRGGGGRQRRAWPVAHLRGARRCAAARGESGGARPSASAALKAMPMAPASRESLAALRDQAPATRRVPLPPDLRPSHPHDPLALISPEVFAPTCAVDARGPLVRPDVQLNTSVRSWTTKPAPTCGSARESG